MVVGKRHRLAAQTAIEPVELLHEILLVREPTSGTRLFVESKFSEIGIRLSHSLELNNNEVIKALVEANLGIAILSARTVETEVKAERLSSSSMNGLNLVRPLSLVSRKQPVLSSPARAFRSILLSLSLFGSSRGN